MPNQRDPNKGHSSITLRKSLIKALDAIAEREDRSRNKVIEILLTEQVAEYIEKNNRIDPVNCQAKDLIEEAFGVEKKES